MTKKQYCLHLVTRFFTEEMRYDLRGRLPTEQTLRNWFYPELILRSSSLAVAAEYLGWLIAHPDMKEYAFGRGGAAAMLAIDTAQPGHTPKCGVYQLSQREIIGMLPESLSSTETESSV